MFVKPFLQTPRKAETCQNISSIMTYSVDLFIIVLKRHLQKAKTKVQFKF